MAQVKSLIANLSLLDTNLGRADGRLRQLEGALKDVGNALAISKRVSDDLTTLDQLLENTHDSLSVAMLIPQVRTPAKYTRRAVEQLKQRVHPVRIKANNVDKKIEPLRKKVSQLQDLVGEMITRLERMGALTNLNLETVKGTQACINAQPEGQPRTISARRSRLLRAPRTRPSRRSTRPFPPSSARSTRLWARPPRCRR